MPNLRAKTWTPTTPANTADAQFWEDHLIDDSDIIRLRSAVQTVESTGPDDNGNVNVFPSGGGYGQVLTKTADGRGYMAWLDPASSGHTIQNDHNVDMPFQHTLQFVNASVSNDSANSRTVVDCHGEKGGDGKSAYQYAVEGGYTGTEAQFTDDLGNFQTYATEAENAAQDAADSVEEIRDILVIPSFSVDFTTGELIYTNNLSYTFSINQTTGNLEWEAI